MPLVVLEKTVATPTSRARLLALAFAGLAGCYSNAFDEAAPNVYYCVENSDCLSMQACQQFRCVSDVGPRLQLSLPEPLTLVTSDQLTVDFSTSNFELSESNHFIEGEGKVRISIDGKIVADSYSEAGELIDITNLEPGAHRIEIQAIYGDGTPYRNPSAHAFTAFFIESDNPERPQVAISYPPPGHMHVLGEPLQLRVAVRNFELLTSGTDCKAPTDCDPFDPAAVDCVPSCSKPPGGHLHLYLLDDYPECLNDLPIGCNGDYVLSMKTPTEGSEEVIAELAAELFDTPGPVTLTVTLQYNDHDPYPAKSFVIYDSLQVHMTE